MKQFLSLLLILSLIFPVSSWAGEIDENIEKLEQMIDDIKREFPPFVDTSFQTKLDGHFYKRLVDYISVIDHFHNKTKIDDFKIKKIKNDYLPQIQDMIAKGDYEQAIYDLSFFQTFVQRSIQYNEQVLEDYRKIKQAWKVRCDEDTLAYAYSYFTPETKIGILNDYAPSPLVGEFRMEISVSFNENGQMTDGEFEYTNAGVYAGIAKAAGTIAHHYFLGEGAKAIALAKAKGLSTVGAGAVTPSLASVGVGFAIGLTVMAIMGFIHQQKANKQEKLIDEVYSTQYSILHAASARARETIIARCSSMLTNDSTDGNSSMSESINSAINDVEMHINNSKELMVLINEKLDLSISQYKKNIAVFIEHYNKKVTDKYFAKLEVIQKQKVNRDKEIRNFVQVNFAELVEQNRAFKGDSASIGSVNSKHELWDKIIEADILYNPEDSILEVHSGSIDGNSDYWTVMQTKLIKELQ